MEEEYTIHEAKTHLSKLIQKALQGVEVVIRKGNRRVVRLTALEEPATKRRIGGCKGVLLHMADDFDEPLEDFSSYS